MISSGYMVAWNEIGLEPPISLSNILGGVKLQGSLDWKVGWGPILMNRLFSAKK